MPIKPYFPVLQFDEGLLLFPFLDFPWEAISLRINL